MRCLLPIFRLLLFTQDNCQASLLLETSKQMGKKFAAGNMYFNYRDPSPHLLAFCRLMWEEARNWGEEEKICNGPRPAPRLDWFASGAVSSFNLGNLGWHFSSLTEAADLTMHSPLLQTAIRIKACPDSNLIAVCPKYARSPLACYGHPLSN